MFVQLCKCTFYTKICSIINSLFFSYSKNSIFVHIAYVLHGLFHSDIILHWHYLDPDIVWHWHSLKLTLTRSWYCVRLTLSYIDIVWVLFWKYFVFISFSHYIFFEISFLFSRFHFFEIFILFDIIYFLILSDSDIK